MKKTIIITVFAFIANLVTAQNSSILVAGSIGYMSEPHEDHTRSTFNFTPKLGFQICTNWTAGLYANYKMIKHGDDDATSAIAFGPFIRYSKSINDIFGFYTDVYGGYKMNSATEKNGYELGVTPAIYANIGKAFALTLDFGGINYSSLNSAGDQISNFNIDFFNTKLPKLGIQKTFGLN